MTTAFEAAREAASTIDPIQAARNCDFGYEGSRTQGWFTAVFLGRPVDLDFPSFESRFVDNGKAVPDHVRALLVYHLATSDGTEPASRWISFAAIAQ